MILGLDLAIYSSVSCSIYVHIGHFKRPYLAIINVKNGGVLPIKNGNR
jgi:hypothetical protein